MKLRSLLENKVMTLSEVNAWVENNTFSYSMPIEITPGTYNFADSLSLKVAVKNIPFKIHKVDGNFNALRANLMTLDNCPEICTAIYSISECHDLTSLKGLPKEINGTMYARDIEIPLLRMLLVRGVDKFVFDDEYLDAIFDKHYKDGDRSAIVPCQDALIEAGYEWAAKL